MSASVLTVAFTCKDEAAARAFWKQVSDDWKFCSDDDADVKAFAVSKGDLFAEQAAIDDILASDLDDSEKCEVIGKVAGTLDLPGLLAEWDVGSIWDDARARGDDA